MPRLKKQFSVVTTSEDGILSVETMGEEELRAWLIENNGNEAFRVFIGAEVSVAVQTRTEVTLGERKTRKPRTPKIETAQKSKKKANGATDIGKVLDAQQ